MEKIFQQENLASTILESLARQRDNSTFCDVILKVYDRQVKAHSNILAAASPYFQVLLTQPGQGEFSQYSPQTIEIRIEGSTFERSLFENALEGVIQFIYTGKIPTLFCSRF